MYKLYTNLRLVDPPTVLIVTLRRSTPYNAQTAETAQALAKLHPAGKPVDLQPMTQCILFKHTTGEAVCKAIKSFPKGTAAGIWIAGSPYTGLLSASDDTTDLCIDALT